MVDPDNEERLLTLPPRVVAAIKAEAYEEAVEAVKGVTAYAYLGTPLSVVQRDEAVAAIEALGENT